MVNRRSATFAFPSSAIEAEQLQSSWNGAKVLLRYDPRHAETFAFILDFASIYNVFYLPEFAGPVIAGSPDPLDLKNADAVEQA